MLHARRGLPRRREAVERGVEDGPFARADGNRAVEGMLSPSIGLARWYRLDGPDSPTNWVSSTPAWH
jgi:hypothetical protein